MELFALIVIIALILFSASDNSPKKYKEKRVDNINNTLSEKTRGVNKNEKEEETLKDDNFAKCCKLIDNKQNIFITGGAGTGKSTLLKKILKFYPNICLTSTTGISACNINAITLHSFCGVGICDKPIHKAISSIKNNNEIYKTLIKCEIIAIDEISMLGYKHFEYIDYVLKNIRHSSEPFGGIQLIIVGDFFQLPPVNDNFIFCDNNALWKSFNFQVVELKEIKRQIECDFIKNLNKIRIGDVDDDVINFFKMNIKQDDCIYDSLTHFYPHRVSAAKFNNQQLEKIKTKDISILSKDYIGEYVHDVFYKDRDLITSENFDEDSAKNIGICDNALVYKLSKFTMSRHNLILKTNCKVMITKNISNNIVNGTMGIFKKFDDNKIFIEINGVEEVIFRQKFELKLNQQQSIMREQFPVILAYALTIHKSQGLTLHSPVVVELDKIFADGQAYVAMSRVVNKKDLIIIGDFSKTSIKTSDKVKEFYGGMK